MEAIATKTPNTTTSLWKTFKSEVTNGPVFPAAIRVNEASDHSDELTIQHCFFPSGVMAIASKLLFCSWAISTLAGNCVVHGNPQYSMAYLTNWSLLVTVIYTSLSFFGSMAATCSFTWATTPSIRVEASSSPAARTTTRLRHTFVKAVCIFFSLASVAELVVLLFWFSPQGSDANKYWSIVAHGPFAAVVLIDGLFLNSIQIKARQILFVWAFQFLYLLWTVVYAIIDIMNPNAMIDMLMMDIDNGIYEGLLNWRLYPAFTLLLAFGGIFVFTPIMFGFAWTLSFFASKLRQSSNDSKSSQEDVIESSVDDGTKIDSGMDEKEDSEKDLESAI